MAIWAILQLVRSRTVPDPQDRAACHNVPTAPDVLRELVRHTREQDPSRVAVRNMTAADTTTQDAEQARRVVTGSLRRVIHNGDVVHPAEAAVAADLWAPAI